MDDDLQNHHPFLFSKNPNNSTKFCLREWYDNSTVIYVIYINYQKKYYGQLRT